MEIIGCEMIESLKGSRFKLGSKRVHVNLHELGFIPSYMYIGMNLMNPMIKPKNKNI